MTQNKKAHNQQLQNELPFDTPLNPQMTFLAETQEVNYRHIKTNDETTLSDNDQD